MSKNQTFYVEACWDADAKVWYSKSDIVGLHIESETLDAFESVFRDAAVDLIFANHIPPERFATEPLRDLVPGIIWNRPNPELECA